MLLGTPPKCVAISGMKKQLYVDNLDQWRNRKLVRLRTTAKGHSMEALSRRAGDELLIAKIVSSHVRKYRVVSGSLRQSPEQWSDQQMRARVDEMDRGQLSQILEPVHEMIEGKRATASDLRERGLREPELMAQLHKLADELDSNANEMAQRLHP